MEYKFCVFIGRFQPLHNAHLQVIQQALKEAEQLILVIGSAKAARNIKNPFTFQERVDMVKACLTPDERARVHFVAARDYFYSENTWITSIQQAVNAITKGEQSIALTGSYKDASSYYIKYFPQWDFIPANTDKTQNATDCRNAFFSDSPAQGVAHLVKSLPQPVYEQLNEFKRTADYKNLLAEHQFIQKYKETWANVPYPVTFNTVDAVVIQSGHVLVVRRKFNPGKGLIALPGGFIKQTETLENAAIRELKEETGIKLPNDALKSAIVERRTFDHPNRSLRGRTITHGFCFKMASGPLPEIKASDDAEQAFWLPLMDVGTLEEEFYEDHFHIINYFTSRF